MNVVKSIINYLLARFSKIQLIIIAVLLICAFIISDSNIFARIGYDAKIQNLRGQIKYYEKKKEEDKRKLEELHSNKEGIEKFARENYLMKKEKEEIFIIK